MPNYVMYFAFVDFFAMVLHKHLAGLMQLRTMIVISHYLGQINVNPSVLLYLRLHNKTVKKFGEKITFTVFTTPEAHYKHSEQVLGDLELYTFMLS